MSNDHNQSLAALLTKSLSSAQNNPVDEVPLSAIPGDLIAQIIGMLCGALEISPVLVDVGASGSTPNIWEGIARWSTYVGFDPDSREMQESHGEHFKRRIVINKAVTDDNTKQSVTFHLTRSPGCSSMLVPNIPSLSNFVYTDLFEVLSNVEVPAITLKEVLTQLSIPEVHWLKVDSQGIDLRVFQSIPENIRRGVLAVDVEPGLIDAYHGEDLFIEIHRALTKEGFWLSDLEVKGTLRMRPSTLARFQNESSCINREKLIQILKPTPGWVEARYLRTLEWMQSNNASLKDYALLWIFAIVDGHYGYSLDIVAQWEKVFGKGPILDALTNASIAFLELLSPKT